MPLSDGCISQTAPGRVGSALYTSVAGCEVYPALRRAHPVGGISAILNRGNALMATLKAEAGRMVDYRADSDLTAAIWTVHALCLGRGCQAHQLGVRDARQWEESVKRW